jgi:hypothetical protein
MIRMTNDILQYIQKNVFMELSKTKWKPDTLFHSHAVQNSQDGTVHIKRSIFNLNSLYLK